MDKHAAEEELNRPQDHEEEEKKVEVFKENLSSPLGGERRSASPIRSTEEAEKHNQKSEPKDLEKKSREKNKSSSPSRAQTRPSEKKTYVKKIKSKKEKGVLGEKERTRSTRKDRKVNPEEYNKYAQLLNTKTHRKKSNKSE